MFLKVFIPRYHLRDGQAGLEPATFAQSPSAHAKPYYVYEIEVSIYGKFTKLNKRYSQFLALHNELRKNYRTPDFPPKKLLKSSPKVLENRRIGLESYITYFVRMNQVPQALLNFLEVPKEDVNAFEWEKPTHQPVAGFLKDPFLIPSSGEKLPDIVAQATLDFFYGDKAWKSSS